MRILMCGSNYRPHLNGQSIFTANLAEGLAASGNDVVVLIPDEGRRPKEEVVNGVKVVQVPTLDVHIFQNDLFLPFNYLHALYTQFNQFRPQIVHAHDSSPFCQTAIKIARKRGIPTLATHHIGPNLGAPFISFRNPFLKKVFDFFAWRFVINHLARADVVLAPSQFSVSMLASNGLKKPARRAPGAVKLDKFFIDASLDREAVRSQYGLDPKKETILYVGRLDIEKRVEVLVRAFALLDRPNFQLAIAGQGSLERDLLHLSEQLGISENVHFLGQIKREELPALINSADIYAMPADAESFSIAILEAMACGRPILAANATALPELVSHGKTGFLFQPGDAQDLVNGIKFLSERRDQWPKMAEMNAHKARDYNLDQSIRVHEQFYLSMINETNKGSEPGKKSKLHMQPDSKISGSWRGVLLGWVLTLILIGTLLISPVLTADSGQPDPVLGSENFQPVDLEGIQRLLVIVAHPDDEPLETPGLIQAVIQKGGNVRIVIVTNGEDRLAALDLSGAKYLPVPESDMQADFQQREIEAELSSFGIPKDMDSFLGYPDDKLDRIWDNNWAASQPITGTYTGVSSIPSENTFNFQSLYSGGEIIRDLSQIMVAFRPDMILVPHPEDSDEDYQAVGNFSRLAVAYYQSQTSNPVQVLGFLVHYDGYPTPGGTDRGMASLPPGGLTLDGKEIFYELPTLDLNWVGLEGGKTTENGLQVSPPLPDPIRRGLLQAGPAGAELVSWKAARLGAYICFGAKAQGALQSEMNYRILLKLPNGVTLRKKGDFELPFGDDHFFASCFNINDLGKPDVIAFSAETWDGVTLDSTAWQFAILSDRHLN